MEGIYCELRLIARDYLSNEPAAVRRAIDATELVHEAFLRLDCSELFQRAENRKYLFAAIHRTMRRILVDSARKRNAKKRGAGNNPSPLDPWIEVVEKRVRCTVFELDRVMTKLQSKHPRAADVLEMKIFGGVTEDQIAKALDISVSTVQADYRLARAALRKEIFDS